MQQLERFIDQTIAEQRRDMRDVLVHQLKRHIETLIRAVKQQHRVSDPALVDVLEAFANERTANGALNLSAALQDDDVETLKERLARSHYALEVGFAIDAVGAPKSRLDVYAPYHYNTTVFNREDDVPTEPTTNVSLDNYYDAMRRREEERAEARLENLIATALAEFSVDLHNQDEDSALDSDRKAVLHALEHTYATHIDGTATTRATVSLDLLDDIRDCLLERKTTLDISFHLHDDRDELTLIARHRIIRID